MLDLYNQQGAKCLKRVYFIRGYLNKKYANECFEINKLKIIHFKCLLIWPF